MPALSARQTTDEIRTKSSAIDDVNLGMTQRKTIPLAVTICKPYKAGYILTIEVYIYTIYYMILYEIIIRGRDDVITM